MAVLQDRHEGVAAGSLAPEKRREAGSTPFAEFVAGRYSDPLDALADHFQDAVAAAASVGALLEDMPVTDGRRHYLPNLKGKREQRHWYIADLKRSRDGTTWPTITFGTYKHGGDKTYWSPREPVWAEFEAGDKGERITSERREEYQRRAAARQAAAEEARSIREGEERAGHEAAARAAAQAWEAAQECESHPYLSTKRVAASGLRMATTSIMADLWSAEEGTWKRVTVCKAGDLLVPMRDADGALLNLQRINATGTKRFLMGGRKRGLHHRIDGTGPAWIAEGYATAATVAAATGSAVLVAFDAGNMAPVVASLPQGAVAAVAADNDANGAGRKGAEATGLPYSMPPAAGEDWNDYAALCGLQSVASLLQILEQPVAEEAPAAAFTDLGNLPDVELLGRESAWFGRLAKEEDPEQVAAVAWAIARRRALSIPLGTSSNELLQRIREAAGARLHPATLQAVEKALLRWVGRRHREALAHVTIAPELLRRHRHEIHAELPELAPSDYQGVILLWAPMASGKTQRVGQPFAAWAAEQEGRFIATCHRRSLVAEMATRLGCDHYGDVTQELAWATRSLATCLPSITKAAHWQIVRECQYLFIDEIAQVLRFLESSGHCRTNDGTNADVYRHLCELVKRARCIIGADAGMDSRVVRFLEECRPGEQFRIIEVRPAAKLGLSAAVGYGTDALASVCGEACARLAEGQRLWISCEAEKRVAEVARLLQDQGANVLTLTADNKKNAKQAAFWKDPEGESRRYDVVIHSPVISSGLSIEHKDTGPWFDHGMFIGSGHAITPADAAQMLRRVRYLRSWSIALLPNSGHGMTNAASILEGMEAAAAAEGTRGAATRFDALVAEIQADNAAARADFAAGLVWVLMRSGFTIERLPEVADADGMTSVLAALREALELERRSEIIAAKAITDEEATNLRNMESRTQEQSLALVAHNIRQSLGVEQVTHEAIDAWDDGRGPRRLDRFSAAVWGVTEAHGASSEHLSQRSFSKARAAAYRYLFDGIKVAPGLRITDALAAQLVERVIERRQLLAYLGIVPAKFGAYLGVGRHGEPKPFPMPKQPQREVGEIFRAMGLQLKRRRNEWAGDKWYELEEGTFQVAAAWAERRNAARRGLVQEGEQCQNACFTLRYTGDDTAESLDDGEGWLTAEVLEQLVACLPGQGGGRPTARLIQLGSLR